MGVSPTGLSYDSVVAAESQRIRSLHANMFGAVASIVLVVAEFFHKLDLEVLLIWQSEWSPVKTLYVLNRVLPFVVLPFLPTLLFFPNPEPLACKAIFGVCMFGVGSCVLLAEALVYLRIYALSGRSKWMRTFLIMNLTVVYFGSYISIALFIHTGSWGRYEEAHRTYGCSIISIDTLGIVTLILSIWLGLIKYYSVRGSPLVKVFYRDGIFYFIVIAVMAMVNGVTAARLPVGYQFLLGPPQAAAHSILVTRMVLHLKQQAARDLRHSEANTLTGTSIQFEMTPMSS
ncbi:hypothetical protein BKA70DRAFT_1434307 [Coprinopsis sp. MPI-PUGE-AT-0042]|nr:hypothetical protein BKA70DRAFT_1434307 [Coprinopsis sp. MPI-PUGE-AT-0042]